MRKTFVTSKRRNAGCGLVTFYSIDPTEALGSGCVVVGVGVVSTHILAGPGCVGSCVARACPPPSSPHAAPPRPEAFTSATLWPRRHSVSSAAGAMSDCISEPRTTDSPRLVAVGAPVESPRRVASNGVALTRGELRVATLQCNHLFQHTHPRSLASSVSPSTSSPAHPLSGVYVFAALPVRGNAGAGEWCACTAPRPAIVFTARPSFSFSGYRLTYPSFVIRVN